MTEVTITGWNDQALSSFVSAMQRAAGSAGSSGGDDPFDKTAKKVGKLGEAAEQARDAFVSFKRIIGKDSAVGKVLEEFRSGVAAGVDATADMTAYARRNMKAYLELGVTLNEVNEASKIARGAQFNLGGFDAMVGKLTEQQSEYFALTGDLSKALEYQIHMTNTLAGSGVAASAFFGPLGKGLKQTNINLLKMGISMEESRTALQGFMADEAVRSRLRSTTSKQERAAIIQEIQGRYQHFVQLGMSSEAAQKATIALEKLSGASPIDRFKQAAKAQAAFAAMGVEGGAQVAETIRLGARATEEQRREAGVAMGRLRDVGDLARQAGIGQEMFYSTIMEKTGMMDLSATFTTELEKGRAVSDDMLDQLEIMGLHTPNITKVMELTDKTNNILTNHPLMGALDLLADLKALTYSILGAMVGGKLISRGGVPAAGKGGGLMKRAGALAKGLGPLAKRAGIVGAVISAGEGIYSEMQGERKTTENWGGMDWINPMSYGRLGGTLINEAIEEKSGGKSLGTLIYEAVHGGEDSTTAKIEKANEAAHAKALVEKTTDQTRELTKQIVLSESQLEVLTRIEEAIRRNKTPGMFGTGETSNY